MMYFVVEKADNSALYNKSVLYVILDIANI